MGLSILSLLFSFGFGLQISTDLSDIFTVSYDERIRLLDSSIDASQYELSLLEQASHKSLLRKNIVLINNNVSQLGSLKISKNNLYIEKDDVLTDFENRVNNQFEIPENMYKRVSFWFDIYTKYDSNQIIFHDMDQPWLIYKVVDITEILNQPNKHKWTKYHESQRYIKKEKAQLIKDLQSLSRKKNFTKLSENEQQIFALYANDKNPAKSLRGAIARLRSQTGQRDHFEQGLVRSAPYLSKMEVIFSKHKLPVELTRIPLVESSFNTEAYSKVGASGVWQIMPHIGKHFGMFKGNVDLRSDVLQSTNVAAKLLKEKHLILKEWPLSITAYNHGPGGLKQAVKSVRSSDLGKILERYENKRFGFASQNFYACFLASLYAEKYKEIFFKETSQMLASTASVSEEKSNN